MRTVTQLALIIALLGTANTALAGGSERIGTSGALELIIPTDARGAAMAGSVVASSEGANAWFWNPAGAASLDGTEIAVSHRAYIADIALDNVSLAYNAGGLGVLGLSVKALSMDDELVYTTDQPQGTGELFSTSFVVVGLSYARALTDKVDFGMSGSYIAEKIYREAAYGVAFDMGFLYRPAVQGMTVGVVVKNYGPKMRFDGPDFDGDITVGDDPDSPTHEGRLRSASFELPSFFQMGVAMDALNRNNHRVQMTGTFQSNNFSEDEFRMGSEWGISEQVFLRGGYIASSQDHYLFGFSAGAGLHLTLGDVETALDYTWAEAGVFDNNHFFSLKMQF